MYMYYVVTLVSHSYNLLPAFFILSLSLVETAYPIVSMFQVVIKESLAT